MRKMTIVVAMAALAGCGGPSKEQQAAQAEAAKTKQALQEETGKTAALETKVSDLQNQNAALQTKVGDLQKQLSDTTAAKQELELTSAKLAQQSGDYAKMNEELKGKLTVRLEDRILFKENSSVVSKDAKRSLDTIADAIAQLKDKGVIVAGYTDDAEGGKGATTKRWQLSTSRAQEVAKYLVARGVDPTRIGIAGFGEARPIAPNDSLANKALNRRVEIALTPADYRMGTVEVKPATLK